MRLLAFPSALSPFVPRAVRDLRRAHGDLVVQVAQLETAEAVESLHAGEGDLAVVRRMPGAPVPDTSAFERRLLLRDPLRLVLPEGHPLASGAALRAGRDRAGHRLRDRRPPAAQAFAAVGIAAVPMHELTLATIPSGVVVRSLSGADDAARAVEALAPAGARPAMMDDLLGLLSKAAQAGRRRRAPARVDSAPSRSTQG